MTNQEIAAQIAIEYSQRQFDNVMDAVMEAFKRKAKNWEPWQFKSDHNGVMLKVGEAVFNFSSKYEVAVKWIADARNNDTRPA